MILVQANIPPPPNKYQLCFPLTLYSEWSKSDEDEPVGTGKKERVSLNHFSIHLSHSHFKFQHSSAFFFLLFGLAAFILLFKSWWTVDLALIICSLVIVMSYTLCANAAPQK